MKEYYKTELGKLYLGKCEDITGFSIPEIYRMLGFFRTRIRLTGLDLYYTEPKTYVYEIT